MNQDPYKSAIFKIESHRRRNYLEDQQIIILSQVITQAIQKHGLNFYVEVYL